MGSNTVYYFDSTNILQCYCQLQGSNELKFFFCPKIPDIKLNCFNKKETKTNVNVELWYSQQYW